MDGHPIPDKKPRSNFNRFFVRGLGILLPTVLTIWLVVMAYNFVDSRIAAPINRGIKLLWIEVTPWPRVFEQQVLDHEADVRNNPVLRKAYQDAGNSRQWLRKDTRRAELDRWWGRIRIGTWQVLDLAGLIVAVVLIYFAGLLVGSFIGRRIYHRGEELIHRLPLIRRVYPAMKQITDFFFGEKTAQEQFSRVVAVQYPRKGLWSVGLVTGSTMQLIQDKAGAECLTVFVPSSPTPFTGYVITVPVHDTIDLPISIEDALKFAVSGGVLVPPSQQIPARKRSPVITEPAATGGSSSGDTMGGGGNGGHDGS